MTIDDLSLRGWFAGQTLVGHAVAGWYVPEDIEKMAKGAYALADAMLKEREDRERG